MCARKSSCCGESHSRFRKRRNESGIAGHLDVVFGSQAHRFLHLFDQPRFGPAEIAGHLLRLIFRGYDDTIALVVAAGDQKDLIDSWRWRRRLAQRIE
jgi:hypothetical protein